jgi:hypothetical protein
MKTSLRLFNPNYSHAIKNVNDFIRLANVGFGLYFNHRQKESNMNEQVAQKKVIADVIRDAKSSLLSDGSIPVIWHMVKEGLIYQISKSIVDEDDSKLALEIAGLALDWIDPEYIIQVANAHMKVFKDNVEQPEPAEMLMISKHIPGEQTTSLLCHVYRNDDGAVTGFSHFFPEQQITIDSALFKPFDIKITAPSKEAIRIVQGMFGQTSTAMMRLVG